MADPESTGGWSQRLYRRYRSIIGDGVWVASGQIATGLLNLAGTRLVTQMVSPELYGTVNLVQNALVFLRSLFCTPLLNAATRYLPEAESAGYAPALHRVLLRLLRHSIIGVVIVALAGGLIWSSKTGISPTVSLILVVYVIADVGRTLEFTLLNAARRQRPFAILSAAEVLVRPLLITGAVILLGASVQAILGAIAISIIIALTGAYAAGRSYGASNQNAVPAALVSEMRRYAMPLIPLALLNWTVSVSDRYIIGWVTHDTASVGVYAAGYGLISQPFLLIQAIVSLTLRPLYFSAVSRGDHALARRTFRIWLAVAFGVCALTAAFVSLTRRFLVSILLAPQYSGAIAVVPWIALGYVIYIFDQVLEQQLLADKRTSAVLVAQACGALASIVVTIPLVEQFGMIGAAYACPAYYLVQCMVAAMFLRRT
jgi:O-antigen/teichoic acid export membrane protein